MNASLANIKETQRSYLLTLSPLPGAGCHFCFLVWQQKMKAVVILNRVVEKTLVKCAQYWPAKHDWETLFKETSHCRILVRYMKSYYTGHLLHLEDISSGESRTISHFHYTTWPDLGVLESLASFLSFLKWENLVPWRLNMGLQRSTVVQALGGRAPFL